MTSQRLLPHEERPHVVYVLRDAAEAVLYVGVTSNLTQRLRSHRNEKAWWGEVAPERTLTSGSMTFEDALAAEQEYIQSLAPRHNRRRTNGSVYLRWGVRDEMRAERAEYRAGLAARKAAQSRGRSA